MKSIKNILLFAAITASVVFAASCKRCATCTFDDPVYGTDTSDFCGKGNSYKDQMEQHEKNGWICVED